MLVECTWHGRGMGEDGEVLTKVPVEIALHNVVDNSGFVSWWKQAYVLVLECLSVDGVSSVEYK